MELWRRVRFVGPLLPYVAGFAAELAKLGYAERTVGETVRAISHLSKWMSGHKLEVGELTPAVVERFLRDRRRSGRRVRSMVLFGPLLVHLRTVGAIRAGDAPPPTPLDELRDAYSRYLGPRARHGAEHRAGIYADRSQLPAAVSHRRGLGPQLFDRSGRHPHGPGGVPSTEVRVGEQVSERTAAPSSVPRA